MRTSVFRGKVLMSSTYDNSLNMLVSWNRDFTERGRAVLGLSSVRKPVTLIL